MFQLIKLAAYALLGYGLYELFLHFNQSPRGGDARQQSSAGQRSGGMRGGPNRRGGSTSGQQRRLNRALNEGDQGRRGVLSGQRSPAGTGGQSTRTAEPSGMSVTHRVGRGAAQ